MEAGLELEALILEKIFKFPRKKVFLPYEDSRYQHYIPSGKPRRTHEIDARPVPWFSRSWEAAGMVVEELKKRGFTLTLFIYGIGAQARIEMGGSIVARVEAETVPMAICLAALKAVDEAKRVSLPNQLEETQEE